MACGFQLSFDLAKVNWHLHHRTETVSTNLDAHSGQPGDVYTADFQSAGRGRLDHHWLSPRGQNLMMSAVLDVSSKSALEVSTLPLVAGYAVLKAAARFLPSHQLSLKWPNDVLCAGLKLSGILCERNDDRVIVGIGVNVGQLTFPADIAKRATSIALVLGANVPSLNEVRDAVLSELSEAYNTWHSDGFAALWPFFAAIDHLKGREISVLQSDDDAQPLTGLCDGIASDGSLLLSGHHIYAGEAHILQNRRRE